MAEAGKEHATETDLPTKADILAIVRKIETLENNLLNGLTDLIQAKLEQMNINIQKVANVAKAAIDLSITQQDEIKTLQQVDKPHIEQLAILGK